MTFSFRNRSSNGLHLSLFPSCPLLFSDKAKRSEVQPMAHLCTSTTEDIICLISLILTRIGIVQDSLVDIWRLTASYLCPWLVDPDPYTTSLD